MSRVTVTSASSPPAPVRRNLILAIACLGQFMAASALADGYGRAIAIGAIIALGTPAAALIIPGSRPPAATTATRTDRQAPTARE